MSSDRERDVGLREVLQDAVREDDVERAVRERQLARVGDDVARVVDAELARDPPRGDDRLEGRVDPDRAVAALRRRDRPAAPVAADVEQQLAVAAREREVGDRVARHPAGEVLVEVPVRAEDQLGDVRVDRLALDRRRLRGSDALDLLGRSTSSRAASARSRRRPPSPGCRRRTGTRGRARRRASRRAARGANGRAGTRAPARAPPRSASPRSRRFLPDRRHAGAKIASERLDRRPGHEHVVARQARPERGEAEERELAGEERAVDACPRRAAPRSLPSATRWSRPDA